MLKIGQFQGEEEILSFSTNARTYVFTKVHKKNFPGRAVVSQVNDPTYKVCKILTDILNPLVKNGQSYVENAAELKTFSGETSGWQWFTSIFWCSCPLSKHSYSQSTGLCKTKTAGGYHFIWTNWLETRWYNETLGNLFRDTFQNNWWQYLHAAWWDPNWKIHLRSHCRYFHDLVWGGVYF